MSKQLKFILAICFQVLLILTVIVLKLAVLTGGTSVLLKVMPVDPRSPLRGDYLTFSYDISQIHSYQLNGGGVVHNGDSIYVTLYNSGDYWGVSSAQLTKPTSGVFIRGTVVNGGEDIESGGIVSMEMRVRRPYTYDKTYTLKYGIEDYFIPEGKGNNFNMQNKDVYAQVMVGASGEAVLKQLYVDGKLWP